MLFEASVKQRHQQLKQVVIGTPKLKFQHKIAIVSIDQRPHSDKTSASLASGRWVKEAIMVAEGMVVEVLAQDEVVDARRHGSSRQHDRSGGAGSTEAQAKKRSMSLLHMQLESNSQLQ